MTQEEITKTVLYQEGGYVSNSGDVRIVPYNPDDKSDAYYFVKIQDYQDFYIATVETRSSLRRDLLSFSRDYEAIRHGVLLADQCRAGLAEVAAEIAKYSGQNE